ncbi:unnamed protein product [Periconia digitata]|uniref:ASX DEUBAD domain-containing protein n=1 Tax=Periconia digitata TaxID=1303443 RepID=A0A9W4XQE8_9PLEO|nr:unnamed protein product [Periconia digitata]
MSSVQGENSETSPLSSPATSLDTPPSAWYGKKLAEATAETATVNAIAQVDTPSGKGNNKKRRLSSPVKSNTTRTKKPKVTPPTPVSSRPSRVRKAPVRFAEESVSTPPKKSRGTAVPRKPRSKVFDPEYVTTNPKSRITKTDLYHLLMEPSAWNNLTAPQHQRVMSLLPPSASFHPVSSSSSASGSGDTPLFPRPEILGSCSDMFRTDVAKFQEELEAGQLTKTWQASATQAILDRAEGKFDVWKAAEAELWWGQK